MILLDHSVLIHYVLEIPLDTEMLFPTVAISCQIFGEFVIYNN